MHELKGLVEILANRPGEFPSALVRLFRHFARNVWDARGGGLYACGFLIALVWIELKMLVQDLRNFSGFVDFFGSQLLQFIFHFTIESMVNTVQALMWPAAIVAIYPPWGAFGLVALYMAFPRFFKPPLERWLFGDEHGGRG